MEILEVMDGNVYFKYKYTFLDVLCFKLFQVLSCGTVGCVNIS